MFRDMTRFINIIETPERVGTGFHRGRTRWGHFFSVYHIRSVEWDGGVVIRLYKYNNIEN